MDSQVAKVYGNKVRVRTCGLCWQETALLMVNHIGVTETKFWSPPGGGVEFGQSLSETLVKEFKEETGLVVKPGIFLFGCEFIDKPIHSVELFYEVHITGGSLKTGSDPEIQIIESVRFIEFSDIIQMPHQERHGIFKLTQGPGDLKALRGFYRI